MKVLFVVFFLCSVGLKASDDVEFWTSFFYKIRQAPTYSLSFYAESRVGEDVSEPNGYFLGPKAEYRLGRHLALGGGLKYITFKSGEHFSDIGRVELEVNYRLKRENITFENRNRMELIDRDNASTQTRFRHRLGLTLPLRGRGRFSRFFFRDEAFYEKDDPGEITENRLVPLGLGLKFNGKSSTNLFYLVRSRKSNSEWSHEHIFGVTFIFKRSK